MKTYLILSLMMISVCAWAMPSAKYIPADAVGVTTYHYPKASPFMKGLHAFTEESGSTFFAALCSPLDFESYGVALEMFRDVLVVTIPKEDGFSEDLVFFEGAFDVDVLLSQMRAKDVGGMVYGKMPNGGIYVCSTSMEERVKKLFTGEEKIVSPTSAFAKLVNEKNDPDRAAVRILGKVDAQSPSKLLAYKTSLIEGAPGIVDVKKISYGKNKNAIRQSDAEFQGYRIILNGLPDVPQAFKTLMTQFKTETDLAKKRFTLTGTVDVKDLGVIKDAFLAFNKVVNPYPAEMMVPIVSEDVVAEDVVARDIVVEGMGAKKVVVEDSLLEKSPVFKVEASEKMIGHKDQMKTFTVAGHAVTLRGERISFVHTEHSFTGVRFREPGVAWKITSPKDLEIERMRVMQGNKPLRVADYWMGFVDAKGVSNRNFIMQGKPHGDLDIVFHYRIKE